MTLPIIYHIEGPWPGRLAIVPRPRGDEWLEDELRTWKDAGFDIIVSLLSIDEAKELGVTDEANASAKHGLKFLSFPIPDLGVPNSATEAQRFLSRLLDELRAGKSVGIHCRQGIGRSGLIATSLMVLAGIDPFVAFRTVSAARGFEVPETTAQRDWVMELSHGISQLART